MKKTKTLYCMAALAGLLAMPMNASAQEDYQLKGGYYDDIMSGASASSQAYKNARQCKFYMTVADKAIENVKNAIGYYGSPYDNIADLMDDLEQYVRTTSDIDWEAVENGLTVAEENARQTLDINYQDKNAKMYCNAAENYRTKVRVMEDNQWKEAIADPYNVEPLRAYYRTYPNGRHVAEANRRIADYKLFMQAREMDTKGAFMRYLDSSEMHLFDKEAQSKVRVFQSEEDWPDISFSRDLDAVRTYATKYKGLAHDMAAQERITFLEALQAYDKGDLLTAYDKFEQVKNRVEFYYEDTQKHKTATEYHDYRRVLELKSPQPGLDFLENYPNSKYLTEVSNCVAITMANALSGNDKDAYKLARSYAKDDQTETYVKLMWKEAKKKK